MSVPTVGVVVVAFGAAPWLTDTVRSVLASRGVDLDVVVVDNGCTDPAVDRLQETAGATVITPGENGGFTGGCAIGAEAVRGEVLAFINPDVQVDPDALARLAAVAAEDGVGLASASVRLHDQPHIMNTAGNPLHILGYSWVGGYGDPVEAHAQRRPVACATGCAFAIRRRLWEDLGGFAERYFTYYEDTELSIRCWLRGLTVEYVPDAVVLHRYDFSRNPDKLYYVERNRLATILVLYQRRTLLLLAPLILLAELLTVLTAVVLSRRVLRGKIAGWAWLWRNRRWLSERRHLLQAERVIPDAQVARLFADRVNPPNIPTGFLRLLNALVGSYWWMVRTLIGRAGPGSRPQGA